MSGPKNDPAALFQTFLTDWERTINSAANKAMGGPEFGAFMQQASSFGLKAREATSGAVNKYLETMNLPSRDELAAIGERIGHLEQQSALINAKLDLIAQTLIAIGQAQAGAAPQGAVAENAPSGPPRTRKPPAKDAAREAKTDPQAGA